MSPVRTNRFLRPIVCHFMLFALSVVVQARLAGPRQSSAASEKQPQQTELDPVARTSVDTALEALRRGALNDAERAARAAVAAAPHSPIAHNVLGVVLDRMSRTDAALAEFKTAIKLDHNFVGAHNNIGRTLAEHGRVAEAIGEFEQVLKIDPSHVQAHYNLGALYGDSGDFTRAAEHFSRARASAPDDPQLALAFLNVAYRANLIAQAEETADLVERQGASDTRALFTLATVLAQSKRYERAARIFKRVDELTPHTYEVLYNLGIALFNLDRNDEAARYLAQAADLNPAPAETHFRLGLIASQQSDHANAVEEFKHAIERDPKSANYHYLLGREYFRVGFWEGAIQQYSQAAEIEPKNTAYILAHADANYRKGEWNTAVAGFDQAALIDPKIENIEFWQGTAHRAAGNFDLARQYLESFSAKHPDHVDALASLGYIAIEQGRLDDAQPPLARAITLDPNNVPVLYDYARLAVKRRDYAEAVSRLQLVVEKNPAHTQAFYQLFLAYTRLKQQDKAQLALAEFKRLEALDKQSQQERILDDKLRTRQMLGEPPQQ